MALIFWEQIRKNLPEDGFDLTGSLSLTGSFEVEGLLQAQQFSGDGSQLTNLQVDNISNIDQLGAVDKVFYVSENGSDTGTGKTLQDSFRTIKKAVEAATTLINENPPFPLHRVSIRVKSGIYVEEAPITLPPFTSILGDDLRTVLVRPSEVTKTENLFLLNNGDYIWGLRLEGCEVDDLEDPRKGFFFALAPGAFITTSPYIQNCTAVHTPPAAFYAPLDPKAVPPNPLIGNGPGGLLVDDSVLDGYSPLKSIIVDAYTQVAFNGIGICVRGRGYAQLVSFFTNFSRIGVYCIDGGHASLLNSNTTFGDYGLRAKDVRVLVVPTGFTVSDYTDQSNSNLIKQLKPNIIQYMMNRLSIEGAFSTSYQNPETTVYQSTIKDAGLLIDAISDDLLSKTPARIIQFIQGLFKAQDTSLDQEYTLNPVGTLPKGAVTVFPLLENPEGTLAEDFILSYEIIKDYFTQDPDGLLTDLTNQTQTKIEELLNIPITIIQEVVVDNQGEQYLQVFGSLITSTAHDFSYAGSGVNFLGLPNNQGGVGKTDFELRVVEENGGRVFHTSGDESGDFFVGNDFIIKQSTGTIEGRTFNKSIAARFTPINLALQ
jgi:hypothetical protein